MSTQEEEPPRKKRRSKWDVQAPEAPPITTKEDTPPAEPTSAAAMAAAKLNAMLASQGKLKPSTLPYMPASTSVVSPSSNSLASQPNLLPISSASSSAIVTMGPQGSITASIDINDLDVRPQLTKPSTLGDINKTTGVMVAIRGKHLTVEEKSQPNSGQPLHIHIQGPTKEKVDAAVIYINSLIRSLQQAGVKGGGGALLSTPPIPPMPPPPSHHHHSGGPHYVQDKVFVGLDGVSEAFKAKERVEGIGGSFLGHIASQTGAKVYMRGRGSGFIEPTSGRESFEAMYIYISHGTQEGLSAARKLCESLIETVQKDYEQWKQTQQPLGFGGRAPAYATMNRPPYSNPYQQTTYGPMPLGAPSGGPGYGPPSGGPGYGPPSGGSSYGPPSGGPGYGPPPPPGYGYYSGPPPPPSHVPPEHAGPYGPPPPRGIGPPPPIEFHQHGPPYQEQLPPPPPPTYPPPNPEGLPPTHHYIPGTLVPHPSHMATPPSATPPTHPSGMPPTHPSATPPTHPGATPPTHPSGRRFMEQVPYPNGEGGADSGPYWSSQVVPRRFTEAPLGDKAVPVEERVPPPVKDEGADNPPMVQEGQRLEQSSEHTREELQKMGDGNEGGGGMEASTQHHTNGNTHTQDVDDTHRMPPPPIPSARMAGSSAPMPPPSFNPLHARTVATSTQKQSPVATAPSPAAESEAPPPPTKPDSPPPPTKSNAPPPASKSTTFPLVAYGDDSDSDVDG